MTVLHTGWTKKFGAAWDSIFSGKKKSTAKKSAKATTTAKKKSAKGSKKKAKGKR